MFRLRARVARARPPVPVRARPAYLRQSTPHQSPPKPSRPPSPAARPAPSSAAAPRCPPRAASAAQSARARSAASSPSSRCSGASAATASVCSAGARTCPLVSSWPGATRARAAARPSAAAERRRGTREGERKERRHCAWLDPRRQQRNAHTPSSRGAHGTDTNVAWRSSFSLTRRGPPWLCVVALGVRTACVRERDEGARERGGEGSRERRGECFPRSDICRLLRQPVSLVPLCDPPARSAMAASSYG